MSVVLSTALALAVPTQHSDTLAPTLLHASTAPTSLHATGPRKLIVMNRGRGGSTVFGQTIAVMAESEPNAFTTELFGENVHQMRAVADPLHRMTAWFANQTELQPHARMISFKWKTPGGGLPTPAYNAVWQWVRFEDLGR